MGISESTSTCLTPRSKGSITITGPGTGERTYVDPSKGNDIALIRLSEPLDLGAAIGAMPIPLLTASDGSLLAGSGVLVTRQSPF